MGRISSMGCFNAPEGAEAKKEAIKTTIAAISADIKDGIISEAVAFEILCSELSVITGIPVEAQQPATIH